MKAIFRMWPITDIEALGVKCLMKSMMVVLPWGSSVKTMCFLLRGYRFHPWPETEILYSAGCNQKKESTMVTRGKASGANIPHRYAVTWTLGTDCW